MHTLRHIIHTTTQCTIVITVGSACAVCLLAGILCRKALDALRYPCLTIRRMPHTL